MTAPQIKLALDRQKGRVSKTTDLIKEPKYRAWNDITVRMQLHLVHGLWSYFRHE